MEIRKNPNTVRGSYRSNYSQEDLDKAFNLVIEDDIPIQRVATNFGIPITTLKDLVRGRVSIDAVKSGPLAMVTQEQETLLARHIITMGETGYGYTRRESLNLATDYAIHLGHRDKGHPLSLYWLYSFMDRNPELKLQKPRKLEAARAKCATKKAISNYFRELGRIMDKYNFQESPHFIFNIVEKGLSTDVVPAKIVAGTHCKPQAVSSGKSQTVTMIGTVNASGITLPPYFSCQRMRDDLMEHCQEFREQLQSQDGQIQTSFPTT